MSSHDKRRCYVGTLEEYVVWLEKEMKFFGGAPASMKKIVKHKGMSCRSLRVGRKCNTRVFELTVRLSDNAGPFPRRSAQASRTSSSPRKRGTFFCYPPSRAPVLMIFQALELQAMLDEDELYDQEVGSGTTSGAPSVTGPFTTVPIQPQSHFQPQLSASQLQEYEY
jgi:hypothetical protein